VRAILTAAFLLGFAAAAHADEPDTTAAPAVPRARPRVAAPT
jgi:hypothetical protein